MSPANPRVTGTVDFFDRHTGRGQVIGPDHRAYWTHRRELPPGTTLHTGERVAFTPRETRAARARSRCGRAKAR